MDMPKRTKRSKKSNSTARRRTKTASPAARKTSSRAKASEKYLTRLRSWFANRQNTTPILLLLIVFALLYLFKGSFIVAMVNGQPIYRWTVIQQLEDQGGQQAVDALVTETLVRQAIRDAGVEVDPAEIDNSIAEIEGRLAEQGLTLDQALAQEGLTRDELVEDLTLQLAVDQLLEDQLEVTEEEIDQYIANNSEFLPEGLTEAELREQVRAQLNSTEMSTLVQNWVQELQESAQILYLREYSGPQL